MTHCNSDFLVALYQRGFVDNCTNTEDLDRALCSGVVPAYIGFDCTAASLHVGSLIQILMLRWLQQTGHKPIVLLGGGTTRVGDPSGRDQSRRLLDADSIAANMAGIRRVFDRFLTFGDGPTDAILADNAEWLHGLDYIDFLRDYGRHFSVNRMLSFDSVRLRLEQEQSLSFLEFNYMVLQAFDFLQLAKRYDCRLQMGGSDQWGNIVNGIELAHRTERLNLFGLTSPLLTTASGAKMGKTADGAVWLNPELCSPYEYWQFWRNTDDADVGRFLRLFTELPLDEIARLEELAGVELNEAKKALANAVTELTHGAEAAHSAAETARVAFEEGGADAGLPSIAIPPDELAAGISLGHLLVRADLSPSNKEAKRLCRGGGARINGTVETDPERKLTTADFADGPIRLTAGRKRHSLVQLG